MTADGHRSGRCFQLRGLNPFRRPVPRADAAEAPDAGAPVERRRYDSLRRDSDDRFRHIADSAPVIIWITGADKQRTYVNQMWIDLTGRSFEAALDKRWIECLHPDDAASYRQKLDEAFELRQPFQSEYRLRRHDGTYRWIVATKVPQYGADGSFCGYIGSGVDVTERKEAEAALASINRRLFEAQDEERRRIARELHDDVAQRLAMLTIQLDVLRSSVHPTPVELNRSLAAIRAQVLALSNDVQGLSHGLHPAWVDFVGISAASESLCRDIAKQHSLEVTFTAVSVPDVVAHPVSLCLYRVLQEALHNAVKHSGARRVDVCLSGGDDRIELTVRDFGAGFGEPAGTGRGLGLMSMRERLKIVDGRLAIMSQPKQGTTVQAGVPLRPRTSS